MKNFASLPRSGWATELAPSPLGEDCAILVHPNGHRVAVQAIPMPGTEAAKGHPAHTPKAKDTTTAQTPDDGQKKAPKPKSGVVAKGGAETTEAAEGGAEGAETT